jgi:predicted phosphodiesterase
MKIALLSDIHGNSVALDAVLADIQAQGGAEGYWVLGDLVALGPDPVGVLERLTALPNVQYVRGNTDRYVVSGDWPPPTLADIAADPSRLAALVELAGTFAWTQGALTIAGWLEWLKRLPLELRVQLPDGTRLLGVHAAPGCDDGMGIAPDMSDDVIQASLEGCEADLVCVGHTHRPLNRRVGRWHVINLGSLSDPPTAERRASYVLLHADETGYQLEHRLVEYDREAVVSALERLGHPGRGYIIKHLRGDVEKEAHP